MMQKLVFESAWDLTIAEGDRENIKKIYEKTNIDEDVSFQQPRTIICNINGKEICEQQFFHRNLVVKANTSMPWTFIFTPESITDSSEEIVLGLKK
jgi:SLAP domain-containing protein